MPKKIYLFGSFRQSSCDISTVIGVKLWKLALRGIPELHGRDGGARKVGQLQASEFWQYLILVVKQ